VSMPKEYDVGIWKFILQSVRRGHSKLVAV